MVTWPNACFDSVANAFGHNAKMNTNSYFYRMVVLNRLRLASELHYHPEADQRAWIAQVSELERSGQVSADKCPLGGQVSAADTVICAPKTE